MICVECGSTKAGVGGGFFRDSDGEYYDVVECYDCATIWLSNPPSQLVIFDDTFYSKYHKREASPVVEGEDYGN